MTSADKKLALDLVAVRIGVGAECGFLADRGIKVEDGVLIDQYLQTHHPDIYAAGDVARFFDPVFRRYRRIEHWDNAAKQGRLAALNMLGQRHAYRAVSYFFSNVFDLSFNFLGDTAEVKQLVLRGAPQEQSFAVLYLGHASAEVQLRAMFFLKRPTEEATAAESLILNHTDLEAVTDKLPEGSEIHNCARASQRFPGSHWTLQSSTSGIFRSFSINSWCRAGGLQNAKRIASFPSCRSNPSGYSWKWQ